MRVGMRGVEIPGIARRGAGVNRRPVAADTSGRGPGGDATGPNVTVRDSARLSTTSDSMRERLQRGGARAGIAVEIEAGDPRQGRQVRQARPVQRQPGEPQLIQIGQAPEVGQAAVGDAGVGQVEVSERGQPAERLQPGIGHGRPVEVQIHEAGY